MKRLFVALAISTEARIELEALVQDVRNLPKSAARKVRPVRPQNLHVTLKFLGATADEQVLPVTEALRAVTNGWQSVEATLEGLGAFPSPDRPRILFAALGRGKDAITTLAEAITHACEPLGFERERRQSTPHVTVARIHAAKMRGALTSLIDSHAGRVWGRVETGAMILYESRLQPSGAVYHALATLPLGAP